ncbi:MAG: antitoxin Xre/MbcA/ParS toxin-binding domain-containing protein [Nitriliruptoraceae bacterium]
MYRDDPLDDEFELRALVGDEQIDPLRSTHDGQRGAVEVALDVLRVLQGWADDDTVARWFTSPQRRLGSRTPVEALAEGAYDDVEDAATAWAAARG